MNEQEFQEMYGIAVARTRLGDYCKEDEAIVYAGRRIERSDKRNAEMLFMLNDKLVEHQDESNSLKYNKAKLEALEQAIELLAKYMPTKGTFSDTYRTALSRVIQMRDNFLEDLDKLKTEIEGR